MTDSIHLQRALEVLDRVSSAELARAGEKSRNAINEALGALKLHIANQRPRGWVPARYNIVLRYLEGGREVDGIKLADRLLGIHLGGNGDPRADVTHIPSGQRIATFKSLGAAMEFCETVRDLYDWNLPKVDLPDATYRLVLASIHVHSERSFEPRNI